MCKYKYLIVNLVFSRLGFLSGNFVLIAHFPNHFLLVSFLYTFPHKHTCKKRTGTKPILSSWLQKPLMKAYIMLPFGFTLRYPVIGACLPLALESLVKLVCFYVCLFELMFNVLVNSYGRSFLSVA